ncbi:MAG: type II secretion system protein M [Planctomycetes bacterium]|nr:type II secretion system protein M [Planctomycetota bacterium]
MARSRQLLRDYGLTLVLLLAAALIYWRTAQPALKKNAELEAEQRRMVEAKERLDAQAEKLRATERGANDPETIERLVREREGVNGLPSNEVMVPPDPAEASDDGE